MNATERLSTIEELRRVMARYVYAADHQNWSELASLFTEDGTFTPHNVDGTVLRTMGSPAEIAATIPVSVGPGAVLVHHLFSDEIDVESDTSARGVWAMEDLIKRPARTDADGRPEFTEMHGYGHYRPRFTKVDGTWKIAELVLTRVRVDFAH
ncbi:nuclear transport factor 2 family protein [Streptomyces andamanensis]|uniref:Nuclear transport factor 2 family protein n=1 Tax=Streptomyces andamanensis TaxID=1565035 RepID=A0ABV8TJN8_9ACTN